MFILKLFENVTQGTGTTVMFRMERADNPH